MFNEEMEAHYETRFRALSEKSGTVEKRQQSWKMRSRPCRQVKREEVAVRRNPMVAALIQPFWSRGSKFQLCSKSLSGSTELRTLRSSGQEEKTKEIEKETGMMRRSKVGGMKALQWILVWILIGVRMQMVEAAEEEIPVRREMERMLETAPVSRVGNMARWRRMDFFLTKEG